MSEAQVNCLTDGGDATFPEAERAAVAYAGELTRNPEAVSDSTYENLLAHSLRAFLPLAGILRWGKRVIAIERPGLGQSDVRPKTMTETFTQNSREQLKSDGIAKNRFGRHSTPLRLRQVSVFQNLIEYSKP